MSSSRSLLLAGLSALALSASLAAQDCRLPTDTYWSNDTLPQSPGGVPLTIGVVAGLCEGEAAAQVFYVDPQDPPQVINKVSAGFGANLGGQGAVATANIEIYDGITWNSGIPTLGPKVFDLNDDTGSDVQLTSTAINEIDLSTQGIVVGDGTNAFVVAYRITFNPNGNCTSGYTANLFTDDATGGCSTVPQTSLIDISGQGWRDARTATVLGFPLCPSFYNGNWVIRACTSDQEVGTGTFTDLRNNLTGNFAPTLDVTGSAAPGEMFTLTFAGYPPSSTEFMFIGVSELNAPFKGGTLVPDPFLTVVFPTPAQAFLDIDIPVTVPNDAPSGFPLYVQGWFVDAGGPFGASASNGYEIITP